ncbi:metallophosphoesterase [candidate division KSB1 bacterium]|nr:metallophosphoesterase [candidate division KSB1 bacterium]
MNGKFKNINRLLPLLIIFILSGDGCRKSSVYQERISEPGNEYVEPVDPARDDNEQLFTEYDQFPNVVKQKIEQVLPGGKVDNIVHWGPFRYVVYKSYPDGHGSKIYIYLTGIIYQVAFINGNLMERPGMFFERGSEREIALQSVPRKIMINAGKQSGSDNFLRAWIAVSEQDTTFIVELTGFQENDTTAFAYRSDGILKMLSSAARMREGLERLWTPAQIEELLGPYRMKYNIDTVINRIKSKPYDPQKGCRFVVLGDSRRNLPVWETMCRSISNKKPDFVVDTGDLVNESEPEQYDRYLFGVLDKYEKFNFIPVAGNHDIGLDGQATSYLTSFGPNSLNYFFDYGNARFIILDNCSRVTDFTKQLEITDRWLSQTPEGYYKFVFAHYPPGNVEKWFYHAMDYELSEKFTALMTKHHVDHVFVGHIHAYSTAHFQGVDYSVTGGGGAELHKQYGPRGSIFHYLIVDVTKEGIKQQLVQLYKNDRVE